MSILSFGEILFDCYVDENRAVIGGAPFNLARYYAHKGGTAYIYTAVGNDALGNEAAARVSECGVRSDFLFRVPNETGRVEVRLNESKVPSYVFCDDTAYHNIPLSDSALQKIIDTDIDALCFGTLAQCTLTNKNTLEALLCAKKWKEVFCDLNIRSVGNTPENVRFCLENATILKYSEEEEHVLKEYGFARRKEVEKDLFKRFPQLKLIICTMGSTGSMAHIKGKESIFCRPRKLDGIVTTVGAGDSYSAAFLYHHLRGDDILDCLFNATKTAGEVISGKIK